MFGMARKRHSDEDCLKILRQVELDLAGGADVAKACRSAGISDATYYTWRKKFGGMARSQLSELKALEKENQRLKKIVADLELDKLILKESLDFLKPKILLQMTFGVRLSRPVRSSEHLSGGLARFLGSHGAPCAMR
jgi:transposase-like protein